MDRQKLLNSAAYRLFLEELDRHLAKADSVLSGLAPGTLLAPAERRLLSTAFHTIRGGAGFFELTEVTQRSKLLEELLGADAVGDDTEKVRALVLELNTISSSLPR